MNLKTVEIVKNVSSGEGLGKMEGKVIFVPFAVAGEVVDVRTVEKTRDFDRGEIVSYRKRISDPDLAKCPYFFSCGGCSYQHVQRSHEQSIKEEFAFETIKRAGFSSVIESRITDTEIRYNYRTKLTLAVRTRGEKTGAGYFRKKSDDFFTVDACCLAEDCINSKITDALTVAKNISEVGLEIDAFSISRYEDGDGAVFYHRPPKNTLVPELHSDIKFASVSVCSRSDNFQNGNDCFLVCGKKRMTISYLKDISVSCGSFTQVNRETTMKILEFLSENLRENDWLIDLYCGAGFFSLQLEKFAKKIIGVDSNPVSVMDAVYNAHEKGVGKAKYYNIEDREIGSELLRKNSTVIIDPPRAGMNANLLKKVTEKKCRDIFYLSCSLPTLLRDLRVFSSSGYKIEKIVLFDMFPLTPHLEALAVIKTE
ncbi:class I SAM-dependent RNA methyltransferase [candidate division WOR-3 bacterium]|nr:class I SAM-dependent RNA methyltransferase [candidate division WOR-3 bacterium]